MATWGHVRRNSLNDAKELFPAKLAQAIEQVDSSSGGIGSAVNRAIETLVPIIAKADVSCPVREKWLEGLFEALQDDMPYLEYLCEFWSELCATPEIADKWVAGKNQWYRRVSI